MDQQNVGSKRTASSGTGKIAAKSQETAEHLKDAVVDQVNQVRDKAETAKDQTSERIRGVAAQLKKVGDTLRDEDPFVARLADRAGDGVDGVARYVSSATARSVMRDTEQLARRQPALFFGGAFLLGLAAGRFLKSTPPTGGSFVSGERDRGPDEEFATRRDRSSGFYTSSDRNARSGQRFQENYDATFSPEDRETSRASTTDYGAPDYGSVSYGAQTQSPRQNPTPPKPATERTPKVGNTSVGQTAGKGNGT